MTIDKLLITLDHLEKLEHELFQNQDNVNFPIIRRAHLKKEIAEIRALDLGATAPEEP